jgi:hypothetical protein
MGPVIIFDKSTLQGLSTDEACWLDNFYISNITPLFFVETLADLEKLVAKGRTPEQVVGNIATKTPEMDVSPNVSHSALCFASLSGEKVEMRGFPVLGRGIQTITGDRRGIVFNEAPETEALQRWQTGDFLDVERQFARLWRRSLSGLQLDAIRGHFKHFFVEDKPKSLKQTKEFVDRVIWRDGRRYSFLKLALELLGVPQDLRPIIVRRWKSLDGPKLSDFAPYAAYVISVDLFFYFALAADLIGSQRQSNKIDIAYLYYLPFCMVFASNDNLHARTAPLFLREDQVFINGLELKVDLKKLDEYYSQLPDEVKQSGIMRFAQHPPADDEYLVTRLWDRFLPRWRKNVAEPIQMSEEAEKRLVEHLKRLEKDAKVDTSSDPVGTQEADHLIIKRRVPARKGKWRLLPPEVELDAEKG